MKNRKAQHRAPKLMMYLILISITVIVMWIIVKTIIESVLAI